MTGHTSVGRKLVRAVNNGGENEQTIAGMFLAKAGDRAVPLIREGLAQDAPSPTLVDVLASIGTARARVELQRVASGSGDLAEAAREALRTLDEIARNQS